MASLVLSLTIKINYKEIDLGNVNIDIFEHSFGKEPYHITSRNELTDTKTLLVF